ERNIQRSLARGTRRQRRGVLDVLPERLALLVLDLVLLPLGDDVDRGTVERRRDFPGMERAVVVRVVPRQAAFVASVSPERLHELHRLERALAVEHDLLTAGVGLGAAVAPEKRVAKGRRITEAVTERLADGLALGLELLADLTPGVHRLRELGHTDVGVPRSPPRDRVAARAVRHRQPAAVDLRRCVERV